MEERTENWSSVQQQLGVLQSEVTVMKSTQTELLTTMQRLDAMLQRIMSKVEALHGGSESRGTMSPILEEEPEQVSSIGESEEKQAVVDQQQSPPITSSWTPLVPQFVESMQTIAMGVPVDQEQSQPKGKTPFTSAWTSVSAGMRTRPESPVERSRTIPPFFSATQAAGDSADRGGHLKLEPPAKFTGDRKSVV